MNRKGFLGFEEVIGLILGLAIISLVIAPFFPALISMLRGTSGDEAHVKANLVALSVQVNKLLAEPASFAAVGDFQFGIPDDDYLVVAFNHGEKTIDSACEHDIGRVGERPAECPIGTCLCLYADDALSSPFDETAIMCQPFGRNVVFLGPGNKEEECFIYKDGTIGRCWPNSYREPSIGIPGKEPEPSSSPLDTNVIAYPKQGWNVGTPVRPPNHPALQKYDYERFVIYGRCVNPYWKVQPLYIEKTMVGDKIYVYIARQSVFSKERYEAVSKAMLPPTTLQPPIA